MWSIARKQFRAPIVVSRFQHLSSVKLEPKDVVQPRLVQLMKLYKKTYCKKEGDLSVPTKFVIPDTNIWPSWSHGCKLGRVVGNLRQINKDNPAKIQMNVRVALDNLNFIWDPKAHRHQRLILALQTYYQIYGDVKVRLSFVIPSKAPWPKETWGKQLGRLVDKLRYRDTQYIGLKSHLINIGLDFSPRQSFETIKQALQTYQALHNTTTIPLDYVIYPDDNRYPQICHGCALGRAVRDIMAGHRLREHRNELKALGFSSQTKKELKIEQFFEIMKVYKALYGHVNVPGRYVVPSNSSDFAEELWGFRLGSFVRSILYRGTFPEYRDQLLELGLPILDHGKKTTEVVTVVETKADEVSSVQKTVEEEAKEVKKAEPSHDLQIKKARTKKEFKPLQTKAEPREELQTREPTTLVEMKKKKKKSQPVTATSKE